MREGRGSPATMDIRLEDQCDRVSSWKEERRPFGLAIEQRGRSAGVDMIRKPVSIVRMVFLSEPGIHE